jgi:hypothetical protein
MVPHAELVVHAQTRQKMYEMSVDDGFLIPPSADCKGTSSFPPFWLMSAVSDGRNVTASYSLVQEYATLINLVY